MFRKLPSHTAAFVMPLVLSIMMTFVVSSISTLRGVGYGPSFFSVWMSSWGLSWLVAFPTLLLILPLVRRTVALLVEAPSK